ncbi:MAG TPA: hypothetical protein VIJ65_08880 [Acidobacteriaceae bacterium]
MADAACLVHDFLYDHYKFKIGSNYDVRNQRLQLIAAGNIGKGGSPACK